MESEDGIAGTTRDVETSEVNPIDERGKPCLVLFARFPSQSFLKFPSLSDGGIQEVAYGVLDVESAEKSIDGGRGGRWPRVRIHFTPGSGLRKAQDNSPLPGAVLSFFFRFTQILTRRNFFSVILGFECGGGVGVPSLRNPGTKTPCQFWTRPATIGRSRGLSDPFGRSRPRDRFRRPVFFFFFWCSAGALLSAVVAPVLE